MSSDTGQAFLNGEFDLARIVEHQRAVPAQQPLEAVYNAFRQHEHEFVAVTENGRYIGTTSRGHVGFLLGARFGFSLYAKQPVATRLIPDALAISHGCDLMSVLSQALSRTGKSFYDDVALLSRTGEYVGMIPVRRLIALQSGIITEQSRLAIAQQTELAEKNQQLFRSLNELRQSQGRYDALLKNSALGIALLNNDGLVDVCNPRAEAMIGPGAGSGFASRNMADWISADQRQAFLDLLCKHEADTSGALASERDFVVRTADGRERLFRFFVNWIVETGQVCIQFHDVTEQRALERQVAINEKSSLFESLVGGIAHELNNKLSPVVGFADLLYEEIGTAASNHNAASYCTMILDSATEAAKLVRQLLQLSRPAALEMAPCDLGSLVADAGGILSYRMRKTGTALRIEKPDVPLPIMADASQIKQMLLNLMMNATDAMEDVPTRELRIHVREDMGQAVLEVSDTGHGIKTEHISRVFDPFFTTKPVNRGTGLGLSVCLSIVRQHKGTIAVDSNVGVGTRFRISLPLAPAGMAVVRHGGVCSGVRGEPPPSAGRFRLMIVDDEQYITALVQETVRRAMGWQVERVHNGRHAIERIENDRFDMLISDVRMPDVDGLTLYRWVREHRPELALRTLFVTGDAGSADLTEDLEELGQPVLYKPFTADELIVRCRQLAAEQPILPPEDSRALASSHPVTA